MIRTSISNIFDTIFDAKPLQRQRFLQHNYRDTFIESNRKPIDVPEMSYGGPETSKSLNPIPKVY